MVRINSGLYEDTESQPPALLEPLRHAGGQSADGAHHRTDKGVERENLIAILRQTLFR